MRRDSGGYFDKLSNLVEIACPTKAFAKLENWKLNEKGDYFNAMDAKFTARSAEKSNLKMKLQWNN